MSTFKRWMIAISKATTDQLIAVAFIVAVVSIGLSLFPWGRIIIALFIALLVVGLLGLAGFALWLKVRKAHDHV